MAIHAKLIVHIVDGKSTHEGHMEAMNILKEVSCEVLSACQSCILLYRY